MSRENGITRSLMVRLVTDELKFCCMYSFLRETKRYSMRKVAQAMGVNPQVISYWREKKFNGKVTKCPRCHLPQTQLQLKSTASGRPYFVRSS